MYCKNCGHSLKEGASFCPSCGEKVLSKELRREINSPPEPVQNRSSKNVGKQSSSVGLIIGLVIVVILVGGYFLGANHFTKEKAVSQFIDGLYSRDASTLTKLISPMDSRTAVSSEDLQPFLQLLDSSPSLAEAMSVDLEEQLASGGGTFQYFKIKEEGKNLFIFNRYVFEPKPYYVLLELRGPDSRVFVNEREVLVSSDSQNELGPYLPGVYQISAFRSTEYVDLKDDVEMILLDNPQENATLNVQGEYVHIDSNDLTAKLLVNGQNTGLTIGESSEFGPVPFDGSIKVYAQKVSNGKIFETDSISIDRNYIYLELKEEQESKQVVKEVQVVEEVRVVERPTYVYVNDGFIFPDSHYRKLIRSEVSSLSKGELRIARNEIYARHGYPFQSEDLQQYFGQMSWYYRDPGYNGSLSSTEEYNVQLIQSYE
ncbi:TcaA 3rd/4th domain-containing protein [Bacillus sp. FJAT-45350]|uniref:TcaA 3rd/4th domain-containing protein n=1 Tax=Bacillus sp. FJAT-45350 TaxID=2011014 RepID=UPI0015CE49E7|nr:YARHG domain-containing protein [Bacillus sp. FJAT-45350]